jgi:hypothetical protein
MKLFKAIGWGVIIAVLLSPVAFSADIEIGDMLISPAEYDFSNVAVGDNAQTEITATNINGHIVTISNIEIRNEVGEASFSFNAVTTPILLQDNGGTTNIAVFFTPTSYGMHEADLYINSFEGDVYIHLQGTGVADEPTISDAMDEIINFFGTSNNLEGDGPGNSAENRFCVFGQMLDTADDLIAIGDYEAACDQLWSAYIHADGEEYPSDFIQGDDRNDLADKILEIINLLGCP